MTCGGEQVVKSTCRTGLQGNQVQVSTGPSGSGLEGDWFIHVQSVYMLKIHLPEHWFHMVLETGYKHLRKQMKSVSERSSLHSKDKTCSWCKHNKTSTGSDESCDPAAEQQRVFLLLDPTSLVWTDRPPSGVSRCSAHKPWAHVSPGVSHVDLRWC